MSEVDKFFIFMSQDHLLWKLKAIKNKETVAYTNTLKQPQFHGQNP